MTFRILQLNTLLLAVLIAPCVAADATKSEDVVRGMIKAINDRDLLALDAWVSQDIRRHSGATPGLVIENLEQFKEFLRQDFAGVPDSVQKIQIIFSDGEYVAVRAIYSGTQSGPFGPFPASGKKFELPFNGILRIEDDKIAEIWVEWDNMNILQQLGHLQSPE